MTPNQRAELPWPEHPRPDFYREAWQNLNGVWAFGFDDTDAGVANQWYATPALPLQITVPFCYQSKASGIADPADHPVVWYSTTFTVSETLRERRCRLHFGAVDYEAYVWVDGQFVGTHTGGYTPFSFDITDVLRLRGLTAEHLLVVRAVDRPDPAQPRGKQSWLGKPFECWYTPVTGIWQTVYLEGEGQHPIRAAQITPDVQKGCAHAEITLDAPLPGARLQVVVTCQEQPACACEVTLDSRTQFPITLHLGRADNIDGIRLWEPGHPYLYDVTLTLAAPDGDTDSVHTYFGMRSVETRDGRVFLNGAPLYQKLVLDQGYWPDTLLTPPDDAALRADVEWALRLGYNGARKHQKIEHPRFYYWADRLGLLVWGEQPSAYEFRPAARDALRRDLTEFVRRDYNHPCLIAWVPLNESWGVRWIATDPETQRFANSLYAQLKSQDGTRLVSTNDGWEQPDSDLISLHDYTAYGRQLSRLYRTRAEAVTCAPNRVRATLANCARDEGQPVMITEYGGVAMDGAQQGGWGYNGTARDEAQLLERFADITHAFSAMDYVQGYCYTQLTDVFQEMNGLLTMERKPKTDPEKIRAINEHIRGV